MLDGLSLVLPMLLFGASLANMIDSALIWCISLAFFLGMKRSAPLVRPGMLNPLRPLLRAMRLLSLAFLVYQLFRGMGAPGFIWLLTQMTTISQLLFTVGLYLVACQPRPPYQRMSTRSGPIIEGVWRAGAGSTPDARFSRHAPPTPIKEKARDFPTENSALPLDPGIRGDGASSCGTLRHSGTES